jgi:hypothetical protein
MIAKRELRIDLLEIDLDSLLRERNRPASPDGLSIRGPIATSLSSEDAVAVPMFLILQVTLPITCSLVANYLYHCLEKHEARRIRIEREEIVFGRGNIERVIREKIDVRE